MGVAQLREVAREASDLLKSLANPSRLMVLCHLHERERSVGELVGLVGLSQSALSQHLARLRRDGLVQTRRDAQTIYYALSSTNAVQLIATLHALYCGGAKPGDRKAHAGMQEGNRSEPTGDSVVPKRRKSPYSPMVS